MRASIAMAVRGTRQTRRQKRAFQVERLESRQVLNGSQATATLGTISGRVVDQSTGDGVPRIAVQLINDQGRVTRVTRTDASGDYAFNVPKDGAYVVREVTPRRFTQVSPTFASTAPAGSYIPGAGSNSWNYGSNTDPASGPVGPFAWDTIAPAGDLPFQSPVNLRGPTVDLGKVLTVNYNAAVPSQIVNNSHQIQVQFKASTADTISYGGQTAELAQFHYHDPAENTVNRRRNVMEEHFVNLSASGAESVVAVFLKVGAHNAALDPILNAATTSLTTPNSTTKIADAIDLGGLLPKNQRGWFYEGSLTTPPLSQPVNWFVYATPITLDARQLQQYEAVAGGSGFLPNDRPVQPQDGRQLNQLNNDVNFQGTSVAGVNFTVAPR